MQPSRKLIFHLLLVTACLTPRTTLQSQTIATQQEKKPTTRDPSYIPPLLPDNFNQGANSQTGAALLLLGGDDSGLASYMEAQQKAKSNQKRSRFHERETRRMLRAGHKQALLEQNLIDQFGSENFPDNTGRYPYRESTNRRFSIISLLALPITSGISFGGITLMKLANGDTTGLTNSESILGAFLAIGGALGIAIYDYKKIARLTAPERLQEQWPPNLKARDGMIEKELEDIIPNQEPQSYLYQELSKPNNQSTLGLLNQTHKLNYYIPLLSYQVKF